MGRFAPREQEHLKAHSMSFKQTMQNIYAAFGDNSLRLYEEIQGRIARHGTLSFSIITFDIQASALMNQSTVKAEQTAEQIRERFLFTHSPTF
jgi:hypothetical protein